MITVKLNGHPSSNCHVNIDGTDIEFVSYRTPVVYAHHTDEGYYIQAIGMYWDGEKLYTPTTARQISNFLAEYFPSVTYKMFKELAINGNILEVTECKGAITHE